MVLGLHLSQTNRQKAVHEVIQWLSRIHMRQTSRQNLQETTLAGQLIIEYGDRKRMPVCRTPTIGEMDAEPA